MAAFAYKARDERGLLVTGSIEAANKKDVLTADNMGLLPVSSSEMVKTVSV
jgi:type II secretory pathway component PulF